MTKGLGTDWQNALAAAGIRTGWLARFDFESETVRVCTLADSLTVSGTGDAALDGGTFSPIGDGAVVTVGENGYSYQGSEALRLSLAIPSSPSIAIANAGIYPSEYLGRMAWVWRAIMTTDPTATTPGVWAFRRIRAGAMDQVRVTHDGEQHLFELTIEAHSSMISQATNASYLDQPLFDPGDHSQDFAVNIANGSPAPARRAATGLAGTIYGLTGLQWLR